MKILTFDMVVEMCAMVFAVPIQLVRSGGRADRFCRPKQTSFLVGKELGFDDLTMAQYFGCDKSNVSHTRKGFSCELDVNIALNSKVQFIRQQFIKFYCEPKSFSELISKPVETVDATPAPSPVKPVEPVPPVQPVSVVENANPKLQPIRLQIVVKTVPNQKPKPTLKKPRITTKRTVQPSREETTADKYARFRSELDVHAVSITTSRLHHLEAKNGTD